MKDINKISIVGGSGTGKTTLSNNLGKKLNLPIYHMDAFHYAENWKVRNKKERDKKILSKLEEDKWIIDGTYSSTLKERVEESDFVIFLDYSTATRIKGVVERYLKNPGNEKEEIPGCKERISIELLKSVLRWKRHKRHQIIEILKVVEKHKIVVFHNRKQLNEWYYNKFHEKIKL